MKNVYVVILCMEYSPELEIYGVYKSKEEAERIAKKLSRTTDEDWHDFAIVNKFEVR